MSTQQRNNTSVRYAIRAGLVGMVILTVTGCLPSSNGTITACRRVDGTIRLIDAEAGETCGSGETSIAWNQQGPQGPAGAHGPAGPAGPAGPQGQGAVIDIAYATGHGLNPGTQLDRLGVFATVDVPSGASVHVTATKVVGTLSTDPPAVLDAWICHRPAGTDMNALVTVGEAHNIQAWTRTRTPVTLSAVILNLPPGQHEVGLCSQATNVRWNDNNQSSVTAMVFAAP